MGEFSSHFYTPQDLVSPRRPVYQTTKTGSAYSLVVEGDDWGLLWLFFDKLMKCTFQQSTPGSDQTLCI